jgi:TonB family protein
MITCLRTCLLLLLSGLAGRVACAQGAEKKIGYLNDIYGTVADSATAKYYRTLEFSEKCYCYIVRQYNRSGQILSLDEYSRYDEKPSQEGKAIKYYENGNIKQEGVYKDDKAVGEFISYYENGKPHERIEHSPDQKLRYIQSYDLQGRELLKDGNGVLVDTDDAGEVIYSKVAAYDLVSCYKIKAPQDTVFLPIEEQAAYPGGMQALMNLLSANVKYPRAARKARIQGSVFAAFVVGKDGVLRDFVIVKGISPECDAEVIRVLKLSKPWSPGIQRGKAVNSRFVLPVKFHF